MGIELISGVVKFPVGRIINTRYGDRINAVITLSNGTEQTIWGNADDDSLRALKKNQPVQLAKDDKGRYKLISDSNESAHNGNGNDNGNGNTKSNATLRDPLAPFRDEALREQMKLYIKWHKKLYEMALIEAYQLAKADDNGDSLISIEDVRPIASSFYIQTVKKFNL